jgi:hypothetical protein
MVGLLDLLMQARESGRGARADLENSINYYIPPELRGLLGLAAEANPVVSMERAGQDAQRLVQPGLSGWERMAAAGDMASNMASVLVPMAAGRAVGKPVVQAAQEGLLGLSMTPEAAALRQFGAEEAGGVRLPGSIQTQKIGDTTLQYSIGEDGIAEIYSMRTPQAKRGAGSARAAMESIMPKLREEGATSVKLISSPLDTKTDPSRLTDFYRSLGFNPTGETANIAGDPILSMPLLPADPAAERGQEIMGMLTSGRAGEVTDQMLDLGDPVLNTRLNEYLYSNYDLPMDYGSRMGRAINSGFDVNSEMYRGDSPLLSFQTGAGQREGIGVTGSSRPDVAASYIPARGEGGIYPLMTKGQNDAVISGGGQNWNVIMPNTEVSFQGEADRLSDYIPVDQYFEPYDVMSNTAFFDTNDLARIFQGYGADRVKFQDIVDRGSSAKYYGPESAMPSDVTMVSNPANVRSSFARFDPRLSHLRNLNAALTAGVPLGLLAMQPEQEQY